MKTFDMPTSGEILLWDNIEELNALIERVDSFFRYFPDKFKESMLMAEEIKEYILKVDPFIDTYSKKVCPYCLNICCLNKNSRYEYDDLIYVVSLRESFPIPDRNLDEKEPCYLLSEKGCKIPRYLRPLRCNWYLCKDLLKEMESAPARAFREFSNIFNKMLYVRQQMLTSFFKSLSSIKNSI